MLIGNILEPLVLASEGPFSAKDLKTLVGRQLDVAQIRGWVSRHAHAGRLERVEQGQYRLTDRGRETFTLWRDLHQDLDEEFERTRRHVVMAALPDAPEERREFFRELLAKAEQSESADERFEIFRALDTLAAIFLGLDR